MSHERKRTHRATAEEIQARLHKMAKDDRELIGWPTAPYGLVRAYDGYSYELGEAMEKLPGPCLLVRNQEIPQQWRPWEGGVVFAGNEPEALVGCEIRKGDRVWVQLLSCSPAHSEGTFQERVFLALLANPAMAPFDHKDVWNMAYKITRTVKGPGLSVDIPD